MTLPAARVSDMHGCLIPAPPPATPVPPPGVPAPVLPPCAITVLIGNLPAARFGDLVTAAPPHPIVKGSTSVLIVNMPAARVTDNCACGGFILPPCCPSVLIGG